LALPAPKAFPDLQDETPPTLDNEEQVAVAAGAEDETDIVEKEAEVPVEEPAR
jgi:hypothetical protein